MKLLSLHPAMLVAVTALVFPAANLPIMGADQSIPVIVMDSVPLADAIRNLARQAQMNLVLDPVLSGASVGADGRRYQAPLVTKRMENVTAREALAQLLAEHKLVLIESPATRTCRITFADPGAKPVAASQVIGDTNKVTALIIMDDVPLSEAVSQLARSAGLSVTLDPKVSGAASVSVLQPMVSFRWENVSAAQALAALLDAYNLEMTKAAGEEKYQISPKPKSVSKATAPQ